MNKKILIAEDNETNYQLLFALLKKEDVELLWAKNGEEAIELFNENLDVDVILMDINMPIMNGDTAAKKIKEINPNIPIIAVSAFDNIGLNKDNFDNYIEKPFLENNVVLKMVDFHIKNLYDEMSKNEEERNKLWMESEKETLKVLTGVSEILELTEQSYDENTKEIVNKLNELNDTIKGKTNDK